MVVFGCFWLVYSALMFLLVHRQTVCYGGQYTSDIVPYVYFMQGVDVGYSFPYPVMFLLGRLCMLFMPSPEWAMTAAVTLLNSLSPLVLKYYVDAFFRRRIKWGSRSAVFSTVVVFSMLFVSMLFLNLGEGSIGWRYRGVFSPNPVHNATYLATRPFSIVCFFVFAEILQEYETYADRKKYLVLTLSLLLTTLTKPSFTFGFVGAAGLVLVYRLCRSGFRNIRAFLQLFLCAVPTFLVLLYQFRDVFMGTNAAGEESGIGFGFLKAWSLQGKPIGEALVLGLLFPLVVLCFHRKRLKTDTVYRFSWVMLPVNLFMLVFLYERGFRMAHINFAWGYMHAMFFSYAVSLLVVLEDVFSCIKEKPSGIRAGAVPALQLAVYLWHLVCGIVYFAEVMKGTIFL